MLEKKFQRKTKGKVNFRCRKEKWKLMRKNEEREKVEILNGTGRTQDDVGIYEAAHGKVVWY